MENKQEKTKEFIEKQGEGFHMRLLQYLQLSLDKKEKEMIIKENKPVFFNFPEGKYSIRWEDLVDKATKESDDFTKNLNI